MDVNLALYPQDKIDSWIPLDVHLDNPVNFPVGITSGFLVVFSPKHRMVSDPLPVGYPILFLGEIPGMSFHGIFVGNDGLVRFGYHTYDFRVIPEEEL